MRAPNAALPGQAQRPNLCIKQPEDFSMYIAMNRFKVIKDRASAFEEVWATRESRLHEMQGFIEFHLLKGPEREDHILYVSHTIWASKEEFTAWTNSEQFRAAHASAGASQDKPKTIGHPEFEGFEVIQTVGNVNLKAAE
jgi:heme-degrading monooxygenase HmoA